MIYTFVTNKNTQDELSLKFLKNSKQEYFIAQPNNKNLIKPGASHTWSNLDDIKSKKIEVCFSGMQRGLKQVYKKCKENNRDFYYLDHPYFLHPKYFELKSFTQRDFTNSKLYGKRYFRLIKNGFNCNKITDIDDSKYKELVKNENNPEELKMSDWRKNGKHILVLPPSGPLYDLLDLDSEKILEETVNLLKKNTDREIRIRYKKFRNEYTKTDITVDLENCWAVVSFGTSGAVKAIMKGIPVFCNELSPTLPVSETDLTKIETPIMPDRQKWLYNLCNNQFSFEEMNNKNIYNYINKL